MPTVLRIIAEALGYICLAGSGSLVLAVIVGALIARRRDARTALPVIVAPVMPSDTATWRDEEADCCPEGMNRIMKSGRAFVIRQTPSRCSRVLIASDDQWAAGLLLGHITNNHDERA